VDSVKAFVLALFSAFISCTAIITLGHECLLVLDHSNLSRNPSTNARFCIANELELTGTITAKEGLGMMSGMVQRMPSENNSTAADGLISYDRDGKRCTVAFGLQDVHEFLPCLHAGDEVRLLWVHNCESYNASQLRLASSGRS
jgi:hypothetical protein